MSGGECLGDQLDEFVGDVLACHVTLVDERPDHEGMVWAKAILVLLLVDPGDVDGSAVLLMVPALSFFIPGDVLGASLYQLGAGRITVGSAQFVYSIFTLLLLYLGVVFGAVLAGTQGSGLFGEAAASELPAILPCE